MINVKELHVNGVKRAVDAAPARTLLSVLRDDLGLTGAKYGCGEGKCGACTVLIDGKAVRSCRTEVETVGTRSIRTIEGLANGDQLHPVQEAFLQADALQCGYCTPGMIMSVVALLEAQTEASHDEMVRVMNGNICRCGTYPRLITAITAAAAQKKGGAR